MKLKRVMATLISVVSVLTIISTPVMAASRTETFYVYINGGSRVSSGAAKKSAAGKMKYNVVEAPGTSIGWAQGVETVNLRGRTSGNEAGCTSLGQTRYRGEGWLSYDSGHGTVGTFYKIALQYASSNPYTHLELQCTWTP